MDLLKKEIEARKAEAANLLNVITKLSEAIAVESDVLNKTKYENQKKEKEAEYIKIKNEITALKAQLAKEQGGTEEESSNTAQPPRLPVHENHAYTCDRVPQNTLFKEQIDSQPSKSAHFFYLYGGEKEAHMKMVERIAFELEAPFNPKKLFKEHAVLRKVERIELDFQYSGKTDVLQRDIVRQFSNECEITVDEHEPLDNKSLLYICEKSPLIQTLGPKDYVCVSMLISEFDWDAEVTLPAVRWFIRTFCNCKLPDTCPTFLFFLAIEYSEGSPLKEEVEEAVHASDIVIALPELMPADNRDLGRWFASYRAIFGESNEWRDSLNTHFPEKKYHMAQIIKVLKKIIDDYNDGRVV